ncbi:hypothetical protein GCM10009122_59560 [Fulvivirga kasyanovii]
MTALKSYHLLNFMTILLAFLSARAVQSQEREEVYETGKMIFNTQCGTCHSVHKEMLGPMLASITQKHSEQWLIAFITNSQEVILSGDEYARHLFEEYNRTVMPSFDELSKQEIRAILYYLKEESEKPTGDWPTFADIEMNYSDNNISRGEQLFNGSCAICHFIGKDGEGPSLGSVTKRLPRPWLKRFIRNSQEVIKSGDPYAVRLFKNYDMQVMPPFDFLDDKDIDIILDYIEYQSASPPPVAGVNGRKTEAVMEVQQFDIDNKSMKKSNKMTFTIASMLLLLAGAVLHVFLMVKLFRYLLNRKKS